MCFYHDAVDYDYTISSPVTAISDKIQRCGDCPSKIQAGEACFICYADFEADASYLDTEIELFVDEHDREPTDEEEDLCRERADKRFQDEIEPKDFVYCLKCEALRVQIRAAEISRGCEERYAEPNFGELYDDWIEVHDEYPEIPVELYEHLGGRFRKTTESNICKE